MTREHGSDSVTMMHGALLINVYDLERREAMTRRVCSLLMILYYLQASFLHAEEQMPDIQHLIQRIEVSSTVVERETLQEIAVAAYLVLNNVPFRGLQDSQGEIEHLILLKNTLLKHPGILERCLAFSIQKTLDCVLLAEVNRRAMARNGQRVTPSYQEGSVRDNKVTSLLEHNAVAELKQTHALLGLSGTFSQYYHRQQFEAEDLLNGDAMRRLPAELKSLRSQMYGSITALGKIDRINLEDFLVVYTLDIINRARDVRMLWEVFRQEKGFYLPEGVEEYWNTVGKVVSSSPYHRDLTTGRKKRAWMVVSSGTGCCDIPIPSGGYASRLLFSFLPYFGDMRTIAAQHKGIFSWFCQSENMELEELFSLESGYWLEFAE